jgi:hypothetical protein
MVKSISILSVIAIVLAFTMGLHIPLSFAQLGTQTVAAGNMLRAVEMTYIQAKPGKREQMKRFLVANWFSLDEIAVNQGLMHGYRLLDTGEDAKREPKAWNIIVVSTYRDAKGYEGIKSEFEAIRKTQRKTLIDGLDFRDLGQVVESHQLLEAYGPNTK